MRARAHLQVTLFPFLSILVCVIGTLTLLIAGLSLGAVGEDYRAQLAVLGSEEEALLAEEEQLRSPVEEAARIEELIAALRAEIERVEAGREETRERLKRIEDLLDQVARARERQKELDELLRSARWKLEQAKEELAERRKRNRTVIVRPAGSGKDLDPRFVICEEKGLLLDPDRPIGEQRRVGYRQIRTSSALGAVFGEVRVTLKGSLILLVRPQGVPSFDRAYRRALAEKVRVGYLPVPGDREIDFSLLRKEK